MAISPLVNLITKYYQKPDNTAGGNLHLVLDDGNVDDLDVRYCRMVAYCRKDEDGVQIANALLKLSTAHRRKIIRKATNNVFREWYDERRST